MSLLDDLKDVDVLRELAVELDGRPIPRVRMTEKEFVAWCPQDVRAEWVNGEVIMMSPANTEHVDLNGWLAAILRVYVEHDDLGKILAVEAQVRLAKTRSRRNPDIMFIARSRLSILKETYIDGPPDLAMEIVSPDSENRDRRDKFLEFEKAGVREYWIVDPVVKTVEAFHLGKDGKYVELREKEGKIASKVLKKFWLKPGWLWKSPLPKVAAVLKELGVR
jgi:Uma2 family endonuclease